MSGVSIDLMKSCEQSRAERYAPAHTRAVSPASANPIHGPSLSQARSSRRFRNGPRRAPKEWSGVGYTEVSVHRGQRPTLGEVGQVLRKVLKPVLAWRSYADLDHLERALRLLPDRVQEPQVLAVRGKRHMNSLRTSSKNEQQLHELGHCSGGAQPPTKRALRANALCLLRPAVEVVRERAGAAVVCVRAHVVELACVDQGLVEIGGVI